MQVRVRAGSRLRLWFLPIATDIVQVRVRVRVRVGLRRRRRRRPRLRRRFFANSDRHCAR